MDPKHSHESVEDDDTHRGVLPSNTMEERSCLVPAEASSSISDVKDSTLVERVQEIALEHGGVKTEWTASTASIHLTANVHNKAGIFEEEEEGELDYEEDEGEIVTAQEDRNGVKNDIEGDDKEEGELADPEQDEEGEEGEILSDEDTKDNAEKKTQEKQDSLNEADGPEEGEVIEDGDSTGALNLRRKICRYFTYGGCTWGMSCRFLHPGLNDKGAYQMLPEPGQYPSPFPKVPAVVAPVHPEAIMPSFPDQDIGQLDDEMADRTQPISEPIAPPKKETAWERGLKLAREIKKAAQKRKEEDADFEEKRMILGITAEGDEDENDKENLMRRREMIRSRLEKEPVMFGQEEEDIRHRRGGDIVSRWRDKRDSSPVQYRDRDRRKKRAYRTPSSSPERDRRSRRRGGEKEKQKEKAKEITKEREKERTKKLTKEMEKTAEEKVKNKKDKGKEKDKEMPAVGDKKSDSEVTQEKNVEVKEQTSSALKEQHNDTTDENKDEGKKKRSQEVNVSAEVTTAKEVDKKEDLREMVVEEKDKSKPKALGISSSRLPNDEWIDPWQRTTSPKRHSASSRSSRSRSSSSSSDSSRSSRSHSGSESRSTSRSASRSRSRSGSPTPSRSRSRSRSGSRSKSRSRSGSRSSGSDRSSSTSSNSPVKEVKTVHNELDDEEKGGMQAVSSESESQSNKSKSPSPKQKSPTKLKGSPEPGPRTPPVESNRSIKEKRNRYEYGRADRIQKSYGANWDRRGPGVRPFEDPYSRERGHHSRRGRSPDRRRRSRSPRNEDRRRTNQSKTRERSSSADSMEHALARPSSPRTTRERGGFRRGSSASSSDSASASSDSGSESEEHPAKTRRAAPKSEQVKQAQNVPLTSGNIRYTGHKDIKLTLNKSVARSEATDSFKPSQHSPPYRSEASSNIDKQSAFKKRPRESSPVTDAQEVVKEAVASSVTPQPMIKPEKRSVDSQAEAVPTGKSNAANTSSRREELLRELKAVEDAIARKRARIEV